MPLVRVQTFWTGLVQGGGLSTHFFQQVGTTTAADYQDLVVDFWTACTPQMVTSVQWQVSGEMDVIDESDGSLIETLSTTNGALTAGSSSADALPPATQTLLRLRTGAVVAGRRLQGRLFIPGPPQASVGGALVPTSASITAYQGAASALITASSGPGPWSVWSRPVVAGGTVTPREGSTAAVTSGSVWGKYAVLRSRRD